MSEPTMISDEQIEKLLADAAKATPGPWKHVNEIAPDVDRYHHSIYEDDYKGLLIGRVDQNGSHSADAAHIANCDPQTITALCNRVKAQDEELKRLRAKENG